MSEDLISRQAAIDAEGEKCGALFIVPQHMERAKQPEKEVNE